jgi:hypothetical protein
MSQIKDPNIIQNKALILIERHLDQLLKEPTIAASMAVVIQNYAKTLAMVAKDQRDALRGFNPAGYTDEELDNLVAKAGEIVHEADNTTD